MDIGALWAGVCSVSEMDGSESQGMGLVAERRQSTWASDRASLIPFTCDHYRFPS